MDTAHEVLHEVTAAGRALRQAIPDVYAANAALHPRRSPRRAARCHRRFVS